MTQNLEDWNAHLHAFVALSETPAKAGPLAGMTVGVKDIIDVAGLPTRNGSIACATALPATQDAEVVDRLRTAGARIVGKTTTTEFAFTDPTTCRNPHDLVRSPGGSSSGSGAAVGAGLVDIALGTQTAGSLIRPAAYCGAVGLKPTAGLLPLDGVTPLALSFDTIGIIARDVSLAWRAFTAISRTERADPPIKVSAACGLWETDVAAHPDWQNALDAAQDALANLAPVTRRVLPARLDRIVTAHRTVMCAEAFAQHHVLLESKTAAALRPQFRAGLEAGRQVSAKTLETAHQILRDGRAAFWEEMKETDVILTLPVPEGAPLLQGTTGFQDWLTPWTVFGGPLLCLPWGCDNFGRPRSVMLAGHPDQDLRLLAVAAKLERHAPPLPKPELPP